MSRWIDADALHEYICSSINEMTKIGVMVDGEYLWGLINEGIENAPTISLVRCSECKYWQDNNGGYPTTECRWGHDETPNPDDFCSYGERREP